MRALVYTKQFQRDVKRSKKRGQDQTKLRAVIDVLLEGKTLAAKHRDHPLRGPWAGYREAHVAPDWLLIYQVAGNELIAVRLGSHQDLFDE